MRRIALLAILLSVAILWAPGVNAQTSKQLGTNLSGVVLDANGKPVANAAISCESSGDSGRGQFMRTPKATS